MRKCQINHRAMWDTRYFFQFCLICFTCVVVAVAIVVVVVAFIVACIFWLWAVSGPTKLNETNRRVQNEPPLMAEWIAWLCMSRLFSYPYPLDLPGTASRQRDIHLLCDAGRRLRRRRLPNEFRQAAKVEIGFCLLANALWILMWLKRWRRATLGLLFTLFRLPAFCLSFLKNRCV